jgi:hypothetical protein
MSRSFIGVRDIEEINVASTLAGPALVSQIKYEARSRAIVLAGSF